MASIGSADTGGLAGTSHEQLHDVAAVKVAVGVARGVCERVAVSVKADADMLEMAVAVATEPDGALVNVRPPDRDIEGDALSERDGPPDLEEEGDALGERDAGCVDDSKPVAE